MLRGDLRDDAVPFDGLLVALGGQDPGGLGACVVPRGRPAEHIDGPLAVGQDRSGSHRQPAALLLAGVAVGVDPGLVLDRVNRARDSAGAWLDFAACGC